MAHVDGGARGNPGPAGFGVVIEDQHGACIAEFSRYLGHRTNNFAEYSGLVAALIYVLEHKHSALRVLSDSELMVRQMNGVYKVRSPELPPVRRGEAAGAEVAVVPHRARPPREERRGRPARE